MAVNITTIQQKISNRRQVTSPWFSVIFTSVISWNMKLAFTHRSRTIDYRTPNQNFMINRIKGLRAFALTYCAEYKNRFIISTLIIKWFFSSFLNGYTHIFHRMPAVSSLFSSVRLGSGYAADTHAYPPLHHWR